MKTKSMLLLLVAGCCGLIAAFAVTQHLSGNQPAPAPPPAESRKPVVVATADQEAGTQLAPDMVKLVEMPEHALPQGTFSDPAEVTGMTLRFPIFKGELLFGGKLSSDRGLAALTKNLPHGMRAGTVKVVDEDARMTSLINPGDYVDVLWLPSLPDLPGSSVRTLLQNIKVLAVGQRVSSEESDSSTSRETKSKDTKATENYTLLVTVEQNLRLVAASKKGSIRLVLRNREDKEIEDLNDPNLDILLGLKASPSKVAPPSPEPDPIAAPPSYEIEYVRGGVITVETISVEKDSSGGTK